jgi:F-type H+-transporting ATPase subunit b
MPQLDTSSFISQIFWLVISFGILYFMIAKFVHPPTKKILDLRKTNIAHDLHTAEKLNKEAESIKEQCELLLDQAKKEAKSILLDAEHKNNIMTETLLHEFDHKMHDRLKEATDALEITRKNLAPELKKIEEELIDKVLKKIASGA